MRVTIIYGTDSGNTRSVAEQIAAETSGRVVEISSATRLDFEECELLILGTPTSGFGDLQCDWDSRLSLLSEVNFRGKKVALFGLGDQRTYADTFVDGMGVLYEEILERQAEVIGATPITGYEFESSRAVRDDSFVGLVLDEDYQPGETAERITSWVAMLKRTAASELDAQQIPQPLYAD